MGMLARSATVRGGMALLLALAAAGAALGLARRARLPRADFAFTNGGEVSSLDPHAVSGIPEGRIIRALFEGLVSRDPAALIPVPAVAREWRDSPDGLTYTFVLRPEATWSNGDAITAADFEWSFRRMLEPETASPNAAEFFVVAGAREFATAKPAERDWSRVGIRALDEHTLEIRLAEPIPRFLDVLASYPFVPVHRASLDALRKAHPRTWMLEWTKPEHLVCNGPFRLGEHRLNDRIRLVKNERYWDAKNVAFDTIDALAVESSTTALNLYLTGEVDWVDGAIPISAVSDLMGRADFTPTPYAALYFYRLNTTQPPLDDVRVRRALALALKRQDICDKILQARQQPALTFVPWGHAAGYSSPPPPAEDLDQAKKLLEQAGYGDKGKPFPKLSIHYNSNELHRDVAEVIAARWRNALGIDVTLTNQEWKVFLDAQRNLDYQISRSSWIADYDDASTFLEIWTSTSENNRTGWKNEQYDQWIAQARVERDPARRAVLYRQAEMILTNEWPAIPIYSYVSQNLVSPELDGFYLNALNEQFPKTWRWKKGANLERERANRMHLRNAKDVAAADAAARKAAMPPPPPKKKKPPPPLKNK